ncbi:MAG TPA: hypothetical protein VLL08_16705 [Kineosporiaceae bacterium]|nr:hypothetical protein [Kineosporiaceae bacterium]
MWGHQLVQVADGVRLDLGGESGSSPFSVVDDADPEFLAQLPQDLGWHLLEVEDGDRQVLQQVLDGGGAGLRWVGQELGTLVLVGASFGVEVVVAAAQPSGERVFRPGLGVRGLRLA